MARDFLLKTIIQRLKNVFLIIGMTIILLIAFMSLYAQATDVNVYAEGIYTDNYLELDIYADIMTRSILSFGVKLTYNPAELSVSKAEKNEDVWYFGNESLKYTYKNPDWSSEGEVDIVGGKLDTNNPLEGVIGERILLGRIIFNRVSSSLSELSLSFLRRDTYKNFVATDGTLLDDKDDGISFGQVTLQYDAPPIVEASPPGGTYNSPQSVTLSANEDSNIYYIIDEGNQMLYISPIVISQNRVLKFYAIDLAGNQSDLITENYTISPESEIDINMELGTGWSMISLPVNLDNMVLSEVFPGAAVVVVYGFKKGIGYVRVKEDQELDVGKGYWILLDKGQNYALTGKPIQVYTSSVENGWYMIGGCSSGAQASVNTGNITVIYRYVPEFGYQRIQGAENIESCSGYWILFSNITGQAELRVEKK